MSEVTKEDIEHALNDLYENGEIDLDDMGSVIDYIMETFEVREKFESVRADIPKPTETEAWINRASPEFIIFSKPFMPKDWRRVVVREIE